MTEPTILTGAAGAVPAHVTRQLLTLRMMAERLVLLLSRNEEAVATLIQRQIIEIPLTDEPDYRLNLIKDIQAVQGTAINVTAFGVLVRDMLAELAPLIAAPDGA